MFFRNEFQQLRRAAPRPRRRTGLALAAAASIGACLTTHAQSPPEPVLARSLPGTSVGGILGHGVVDSAGETVGPLVDVLIDPRGQPVAGIIDVGGFFGLGSRPVAVAWRLLSFTPDNGGVRIDMRLSFDSAAAAPAFQGPDNTLIVIDRPPP